VRFAVHRPGCPVASPRSHGVPRRDIPGRIYVRMFGETAGCACEPRLALARIRVHVPARRAALTRINGAYLFHPSGSLLAHPPHQQAPAGSQDSTVEPGLSADVPARILGRPLGRARHVPDLQVLDADQVEPACEIRAGLLRPVLASISLAGTQPGDGQSHPPATIRTPFGAGQFTLQPAESSALRRGQAGHTQQLARGKGCADNDATVDADSLTVTRCGDRLRDRGEGDVPAPSPVHRYPVGLGAWRHGAGPSEPHPARLRYPDCAGFAAEPSHLPGLDGDNAEPLVSSGLTPCGSAAGAGEEIRYSPSEVAQGLLLHHLRACGQPRVLRAGSSELPALLQVGRRARSARAPVGVLLDGKVPDVSSVTAMTFQHDLLVGRGEQPVPRHTNTLANTADIYGEVKRRFVPGLKSGVSAPRSR